MRPRLVVLLIAFCLALPVLARADSVLYTFSADYSSAASCVSGDCTINWQFEVPSLLTTPTTITSFISTSLGPGLTSQGCTSIANVQLPLPGAFPGFSGQLFTNYPSPCGPGNQFIGAGANFLQSITSFGVFDVVSHQDGHVLGTLTISAAPEPSAEFLLGTELLVLVGFCLLTKAGFCRGSTERRNLRSSGA
jgi:hypothetical protein